MQDNQADERPKRSRDLGEVMRSYFVLRKDQYKWLRQTAFDQHTNMSMLMREALDLFIKLQAEKSVKED